MEDTGETEIDLLAGSVDIIVNKHFVNNDKLIWRSAENGSAYLTLNEISAQLNSPYEVIYVWIESGLSGVIYQCNNYGDGKWYKHGMTKGYA